MINILEYLGKELVLDVGEVLEHLLAEVEQEIYLFLGLERHRLLDCVAGLQCLHVDALGDVLLY